MIYFNYIPKLEYGIPTFRGEIWELKEILNDYV